MAALEEDVRSRLAALLSGSGSTADETVLAYAVGVLAGVAAGEDGADEESAQEHLEHVDLLLEGGCEGGYASVPGEERRAALADIVFQVQRAAASARQESPPSHDTAGTSLASSISGLTLTRSGSRSGGGSDSRGDGPSTSGGGDGDGGGGSGGGEGGIENRSPTATALRELAALCSWSVTDGFLQYMLQAKCAGSVEALAGWLLDAERGEVAAAEREFAEAREREVRQREEQRLLQERNKQAILGKYDLRPVPAPRDPRARPPKDDPVMKHICSSAAPAPKVRYLDGRIVTTKGEKVVVIKDGEEWDGGSRGKVYTKGKRGKGFA